MASALAQKVRSETTVIDPDAAETVKARLRALGDLRPSLVVNECDALAVCWRLSGFLTETIPSYKRGPSGIPMPMQSTDTRFGLLHHRLALNHGGDVNAAARPFMLLIDAPGIRRHDIRVGLKPAPTVEAEVWHDSTFALEELEALANRRTA
jgi:hypothetical protein